MGDHRDEVDPADLAEQEESLRDDPDEDEIVVDVSDPEVDVADRWEQARPVGGDDDDYPAG